jgi:hypothetical protein
VGAALLAFFLGSVIAALMASAHNGPINQRRLQAANLAREGVQLVTQIRDTIWLNNGSFSGCDCNFCFNGDVLKLVPNTPGGSCWSSFKLNNGPQTITQNGTIFTREININNSGSDKKKVTSKVSWSEGGQTMDVTMNKFLTNWDTGW